MATTRLLARIAFALLYLASPIRALSLDITSTESISNVASQIAYGMLSYYTGNITGGANVGLLPSPYYWWEAGAMWNGLLNYWHYTSDSTYNDITSQAILANVGPDYDFIVPTQSFDEGNDDQAFWGMAAMTAAEMSFPAPAAPYPSWLQLAENMWNTQVYRWNTTQCGGGLKWQFYPANAGYDYKNSVSNGCFFQVAARLLRYTGNTTYMDWAETTWDWSTALGLVQPGTYNVYDGMNDLINCTQIDHDTWSYNLGLYLLGAATMYNYTDGSEVWYQRTSGLLTAASTFFSPYSNATSIMYETMCETTSTCNTDQQSFKASLASNMYKTMQLAPFTAGAVSEVLIPSALGAAASCAGSVTTPQGIRNNACGSRWYINGFDNVFGVGEQLTALEVISGLLVNSSSAPGTGTAVVVDTGAPVYSTNTTLAIPDVVATSTSTSTSTLTSTSSSTSSSTSPAASTTTPATSSTSSASTATASHSAAVIHQSSPVVLSLGAVWAAVAALLAVVSACQP